MKWTVGTIGLLMIGLAFKLSLLVYAMYVLLGVMMLSRFFSKIWMDGIAVERSCFQDVVEIGGQAGIEITVRNLSRINIPWLLIEESLPRDAMTQMPPRLKTKGPRLKMIELNAQDETSFSYTVKFERRGYYQFGPLLAETGDLFGLHRRFIIATNPHFVLVLPKVIPLQGYDLSSRRPIGEIRIAHRLFEDPTRISAIRPFQPGDPLNRIHWRATARTGELHSRVYENSCVAGATILLDFHLASYEGTAAGSPSELAVTTVASITNAIYELGQQIGLVTNGRDAAERIKTEGWQATFTTRADAQRTAFKSTKSDRLRPIVVRPGKGADRLAQILEALGRLELTDGLTFSDMVAESESELPRDATVIAVLHQVTPEAAIALGTLERQGYAVSVVVVQFNEHEIPNWARPPAWAELLLAEGLDFKMVTDEESLSNLCAERVLR